MRLIRGDLRFKQTGCSGSDAGVGARFTQLIERAIHGGAGLLGVLAFVLIVATTCILRRRHNAL